MQNNIQNIEQRIRELFREQTIYKREHLIAMINIRKKYPIEHIFYVITQLDDLVDPYGRVGCLINKGKYYAFQPKEIADENISVFERSRPIDYKRDRLSMELGKIDIIKRQQEQAKSQKESNTYEMILSDIRGKIKTMYLEKIIMEGGDNDWFKNANFITDILIKNHDIGPRELNRYAIHHILDTMLVLEKIILLKELFDGEEHERDQYEIDIYDYLDKFITGYNGKRAIVMADGTKNIIYIEIKTKGSPIEWREADPEDYFQISANFQESVIPRENIASIFGFIHPFKKGEMVFKIKKLGTDRNKSGIKCINMNMVELIKQVNQLVGKDLYSTNTKIKKIAICVLYEILMREHLEKNRNNSIVFFPPEFANINSVDSVK